MNALKKICVLFITVAEGLRVRRLIARRFVIPVTAGIMALFLDPYMVRGQVTTFDFETNVTGYGTKNFTNTVSGQTLVVTSVSANIFRGSADYGLVAIQGSESMLNSDGSPPETSVTFSVQGGKLFNLTSFRIRDETFSGPNATITASGGKTATFGTTSDGSTVTVNTSTFATPSDFNNISSFTLTSGSGFIFSIDALVLNIQAADVTPPTITGVSSSTANGTYKLGDVVAVTMTFSETVIVTGTPQLLLETGTTDRLVNYSSGSGTATLTFNYTVQAGDVSTDLDYNSTGALSLNGGTIKDAAGNNATLTLAAPGAAGSLGANKAIVIDGVVPTISNVSSSTANGTYKVGDVIAVTVAFSEAVTITGTPQLQLETGTTDRTVNYASGSGTTTLTFNYTVQAGDVSSDLDYTGTGALTLNGGTVRDAAGNNATLTLATPGAAGSLGANKAIVVDGVVPTVSNVSSSTANGTYKVGDVIAVTVTFSESVTITGTPQLQLETGTTDRTVNYVSGSGTTTLTFNYTVQTGDVSSDLDYTGTGALALNGGTIRDGAGNNATLTLATPGAAGSLGANKAIVIDGVLPTVSNVSSSTANGTYKVGDVIAVTVTFGEAVTVTGTPQLQLETGTTDQTINYTSGSGTATLTFNYTVQTGDVSSDLDYTGTGALTLNGGTIRDGAGNNATLTLATPGAAGSLGANKAIVIDGVVPTVSNVSSSTANGTYKVGDVIAVTISFSEAVTVTGTPQLQLETGTIDQTVNYTSGSGTATLTFNYTVQTGDVSSDLDYTGTGALALNGGTIRDGAGNNATLTLAAPGAAGSLGANKAIVIDGVVPAVSNVSSGTANGTYKVGDVIAVTITFSESVTVTGTPQLQLETGTTDRTINYTSGSGTATLTFNYTVQAGDVSSDLDYTGTGALTLNGGTIRDGAGNNATLTLSAPGAAGSLGANKAIVIDGTSPTVTNVSSSTANGTYKVGDVIAVTVTFSETVTVTGTPQLQLETGTTDRTVNYTSGSGTTILTFNYTVQAGDISPDLDYTGTGALTLNGGTIRDATSNDAILTLAAPGAAGSLGANKALGVDGVTPTVTNVSSSTANGTYKTGDLIAITITFSETVMVTGTPQLQLETGTTDQIVNYSSGSGTATLTFNYTVQTGDISSDLDYTGTGALTLNGGTIRDGAGNGATLTLAVPGGAGSIGGNKAIVVDGVAPTVTNVSSSTANGTYKVGDAIAVIITFSEAVTVTGTPQLQLETGTTDRNINYASGSGTATLTFNYTVQSGDVSSDLDYTGTGSLALNGGTIRDAAGNNGLLTLAAPGAAGSLGANKAIVIDGVVPVVSSVSVPADDVYAAGEALDFTIQTSEVVNVVTSGGTPQLSLTIGATTRQAVYQSGSGTSALLFRYTVQAGEVDNDGIAVGTLSANGGTLRDGAGNNLTLALNSVGATTNVLVDASAPTVSISSTKTSPTNASAIDLTFTFSEGVSGFIATDITLSSGSLSNFATTNNITFTATLSGMSEGTVTVNVAAGAATDAGGNGNTVSNAFSIVYDGTAPTVVITSSESTPTNASPIAVTITFSEAVSNFISSDVGVTNGTLSNLTSTDGIVFTADVTPAANGAVGVAVNAGVASDASGNGNSAATPFSITYDGTSPAISSLSPADGTTDAGTNPLLGITFSEDIVAGSGSITILRSSDNSIEQSISVTDASRVSIAGSSVSITLASFLPTNTSFYVHVNAGAFTDEAGNGFAGVADATTWNFTTVDKTQITIDDPMVTEGNSGTVTLSFTVSLNQGSIGTTTVDYATADGTAIAGADYVATSGTLTFAAGERSKTISVTINGDAVVEGDKTVLVNLSQATGANVVLGDAQGIGTITDDDGAKLTFADASGNEDSGPITITLTLDKAVQGGFTVAVSTADGTAIAGTDYTAIVKQVLTFAGTANESKTFTVTPTANEEAEPTKSLKVFMSDLGNTLLGVDIADEGTVNILNDDVAPVVTAGQVFTIRTDMEIGTVIGTVGATDADGNTLAGWAITNGNTSNHFAINAGTGELTLADNAGLADGQTFDLSVTVTDGFNTSETGAVKIVVSDVTEMLIPEGLSPNGDGANDAWVIPGIEKYPNNRVVIFNRWGNEVYRISGYDNGAKSFRGASNNGLKFGSDLPDGTYYYVLELDGSTVRKGYLVIKK